MIGYYTSYNFLDPANCANVADAFGGTTGVQTRPDRPAPYCGSMFTPGYRTVKNGKEGTQLYSHATFDISDNTQLYGDVLYSDETVDYHIGSNFTWWGTSVKWGYFFDPNLGDFMQLQRAFAPEDMAGGWEQSMNHDDSKSYAVTFGINGTFGDSTWDYDAGFTRTEYKLTENSWARLANPINDWFEQNILGTDCQPGLGPAGLIRSARTRCTRRTTRRSTSCCSRACSRASRPRRTRTPRPTTTCSVRRSPMLRCSSFRAATPAWPLPCEAGDAGLGIQPGCAADPGPGDAGIPDLGHDLDQWRRRPRPLRRNRRNAPAGVRCR